MIELLDKLLLFFCPANSLSFSCSNGNGHNWNELSTVIKAPKGQGCPKCDGFVYHADQGRKTKRGSRAHAIKKHLFYLQMTNEMSGI